MRPEKLNTLHLEMICVFNGPTYIKIFNAKERVINVYQTVVAITTHLLLSLREGVKKTPLKGL